MQTTRASEMKNLWMVGGWDVGGLKVLWWRKGILREAPENT